MKVKIKTQHLYLYTTMVQALSFSRLHFLYLFYDIKCHRLLVQPQSLHI